ncbi:MAG: hypothetical protein AABX75_01215, partial [Nanoarchaeota archaeon]
MFKTFAALIFVIKMSDPQLIIAKSGQYLHAKVVSGIGAGSGSKIIQDGTSALAPWQLSPFGLQKHLQIPFKPDQDPIDILHGAARARASELGADFFLVGEVTKRPRGSGDLQIMYAET